MITFRPAKREQVGLLVAVAGASGSGKTYSCLRLATGLAGDKRFAVIDTEARRALHYADQFTFDHTDFAPPFSPERYLEHIVAADEAGYPVIVADSWSHEWAGIGGCCEQQEAELDRMAGDNWQKREACRLASWIRPKVSHRRLISKLLQLRAHIVFALRAEPKVEMQRGPDGKMQVLPKKLLGWSSEWIPVTEKSFMFEMTASFVLSPDKPGLPIPIKLQEQHRAFFPLDQPISEESGRLLAAWAKGGTTSPAMAPGQTSPGSHGRLPGAAAGGDTAASPNPRAALLAEIKDTIMGFLPRSDEKSKKARAAVIRQIFGDGMASWSDVAKLPLERLEAGKGRLESVCADHAAALSEGAA